MNKTSIAWTEMTWNPLLGCRRASPGCAGCYAERLIAVRFSKNPKLPMYHGIARVTERGEPQFTGARKLLVDRLDEPLRRRKGAKVFVCDMGDIFFEGHPFDEIAAVFGVMAAAQRHTFQILTKRAERMAEFFAWVASHGIPPVTVCEIEAANRCDVDQLSPVWPLPNVWVGVSVEDRERKSRIDVLRTIPAAVRFLSVEPLLEDLGAVDLSGIHWMIVGGESGPRARPFGIDWARDLRNQCAVANTAFFMKQLGAAPVLSRLPEWHEGEGAWKATMEARGGLFHVQFHDSHGADTEEWPADLRVQQFPTVSR